MNGSNEGLGLGEFSAWGLGLKICGSGSRAFGYLRLCGLGSPQGSITTLV